MKVKLLESFTRKGNNVRQFEKFFNKIAKFRSDMRNIANSDSVKDLIGDSKNNNRTVSVNQVVRYLDKTGKKRLARQLKAVNKLMLPRIKEIRKSDGVKRTDAVDMEELVRVYRVEVMDSPTYRPRVTQVLWSTK